jgi:3-oxoacyl-[acyl-carrier protein] reductase
MSQDYRTKIFMLTGCASGIGRHMAEALLKQGARVLVTDINYQALQEIFQNHRDPDLVRMKELDVRSAESWEKAFEFAIENWGKVDVLMNIAGYLLPGYINEVSIEEINKHIDINTKGVIFGTHLAVKQMLDQGFGHIINIASLAGIAAVPGLNLYSASKFAVRGFSLAVAEELKPHGIFVTVVCPDAVRTPMLDSQANYEEAALTFSGSRILSLTDIEDLILNKVLKNKPCEVMFPVSRGIMAKLSSAFPNLVSFVAPSLKNKGLKKQKEFLKESGK